MTTHLVAAVERYPDALKTALIHPVSEQDAAIIEQLITIVNNAGLTDVSRALSIYKFQKDTEVLALLKQYAAQHKEPTEPDQEPVKGLQLLFTRNFIQFRDLRLEAAYIHCWERHDEWNFVKGAMMYDIIINDLPDTTSVRNVTTHKQIRYERAEQRDADFEMLDNYMAQFPGINIIKP